MTKSTKDRQIIQLKPWLRSAFVALFPEDDQQGLGCFEWIWFWRFRNVALRRVFTDIGRWEETQRTGVNYMGWATTNNVTGAYLTIISFCKHFAEDNDCILQTFCRASGPMLTAII
jgi:hypothetical protein